MTKKIDQQNLKESAFRKIVKEETAYLVTKKGHKTSFDYLNNKIDDAVTVLNEKIDHVANTLNYKIDENAHKTDEQFFDVNVKLDKILNKMDDFSGALVTEKQERIIGDKQLERRVGKLEARA